MICRAYKNRGVTLRHTPGQNGFARLLPDGGKASFQPALRAAINKGNIAKAALF